ncbi:MAG: hypothetical protein HN707_10650 [Verrucomicrobia bacterium]|jgi:hypothetical protein|nr:hypothetical protein [Verrucomicrobiota bacterium]MBT3913421.1 hypothetical protein [Verrucomicrobiota bacterium]MBT4227052.1 hypothetical protein [Verrucomicrobiota bacterium]MBT4624875.1 hypothetical protein [Verrucomicrobiota bacterium]MBT4901795.1 hypothetical protein [Verrucomicrobiota bacterium]|tara:strand:- start:568 stop:789 length:222 start_codon:yes stop_codon:yes gene_type:complete
MQRVKLFKGLETEVEALEQQINVWVESEGAKIIQVTGNIATQSYNPAAKSGSSLQSNVAAASDVLIVVLYEKG